MRVFVTGGNGFIGSAVVRKLIEDGRSVRCLIRSASKITRIANLEFVPQCARDVASHGSMASRKWLYQMRKSS